MKGLRTESHSVLISYQDQRHQEIVASSGSTSILTHSINKSLAILSIHQLDIFPLAKVNQLISDILIGKNFINAQIQLHILLIDTIPNHILSRHQAPGYNLGVGSLVHLKMILWSPKEFCAFCILRWLAPNLRHPTTNASVATEHN